MEELRATQSQEQTENQQDQILQGDGLENSSKSSQRISEIVNSAPCPIPHGAAGAVESNPEEVRKLAQELLRAEEQEKRRALEAGQLSSDELDEFCGECDPLGIGAMLGDMTKVAAPLISTIQFDIHNQQEFRDSVTVQLQTLVKLLDKAASSLKIIEEKCLQV